MEGVGGGGGFRNWQTAARTKPSDVVATPISLFSHAFVAVPPPLSWCPVLLLALALELSGSHAV